MSILINGTVLGTQPSTLTEEFLNLQTDQEAIDGTTRRNKYGQKRRATLSFSIMQPSDYQNLISQFSTGSGVLYSNTASNYAGGILTFSGLPTFTESPYVQGSSLYRNFDVVIKEI